MCKIISLNCDPFFRVIKHFSFRISETVCMKKSLDSAYNLAEVLNFSNLQFLSYKAVHTCKLHLQAPVLKGK